MQVGRSVDVKAGTYSKTLQQERRKEGCLYDGCHFRDSRGN